MRKRRFIFSLVMAVALIVTFVPLQDGQVFAASKPAKAKITSFTQAAKINADATYTLTAKWKAAKNAKKYKVIIKENGVAVSSKIVSKNVKKVTYPGTIGQKYTVSVQSMNGKKTAKAATKSLTVKDKRAEVKSVYIDAPKTTVGSTLTAVTVPADAAKDAIFTWYQVGSTTPLAKGASYVAQESDVDKQLTVTAMIAGSTAYRDASLTATMTGTIIEAPKADFYAAATPVIANGTPASVLTNIVPDTGSVIYEWHENDSIVLKSETASTYAQKTDGVKLTCVVTYKVDSVDKSLTVDFGTVAKDAAADYVLKVRNMSGTETTDLAAGDALTAIIVSKTDDKVVFQGDATYEWYYTDSDNKKVVLSDKNALAGDDKVIGKSISSIALAVTVKPTEEYNYSGTFSSTITPGQDIADAIAISGEAVVGGTMTAAVTGVAKTDMSSTASIGWQYYVPGTDSWSDINAEAAGNKTYKIDKAYYGKDIRAKVQVSAGIYKYSDKVTVGKAVISGVAVKWVASATEINDVTIGKPVTAVIEPAELKDLVDVTYYASTKKDDVENCTDAAKMTADPTDPSYAADEALYYGAKIALKTGVDYAEITKATAAAVQPIKEKSPAITTVGITAKNGTEDVTLNSSAKLKTGYVLTASADASQYKPGEKLTYQWFRNNDKNPVGEATESPSYTLTGEDVGLNKIGVKVFCEGHYAPADVQAWIVKGADYAAIEAADIDMDATASFANKVGEKCAVTGAPSGSTYTWTASDIANPETVIALTPAATDLAGECTIPAVAYGFKISVSVAKAGYNTFTATQSGYVNEIGEASLKMKGSSSPYMANVNGSESLTLSMDKADAMSGTEYKWTLVKDDQKTATISGTKSDVYQNLKDASTAYTYIYAEAPVKPGYGGGTVKSDKMAVYDSTNDRWSLQDNIF